MDPIYVYFDVPERLVLEHLRDLKGRRSPDRTRHEPGPAHVATATDEGYPHESVIDYVDNTVDPDTGTIQVRAVAPNADSVLFPGLFVRVRVPGPVIKDALLVEERAVGTDLNGKYLYVIGEENIVEPRYIELGPPQDDGLVAVLSGLEGDETYVVEGVLKARPGLPVTPQPRPAES
jgi:multidrug efflux system membrane fusion protein